MSKSKTADSLRYANKIIRYLSKLDIAKEGDSYVYKNMDAEQIELEFIKQTCMVQRLIYKITIENNKKKPLFDCLKRHFLEVFFDDANIDESLMNDLTELMLESKKTTDLTKLIPILTRLFGLKKPLMSRATRKSSIRNSRTVTQKRTGGSVSSQNNECGICLNSEGTLISAHGDDKRRKHLYHKECLLPWMSGRQADGTPNTCPECRQTINISDNFNEELRYWATANWPAHFDARGRLVLPSRDSRAARRPIWQTTILWSIASFRSVIGVFTQLHRLTDYQENRFAHIVTSRPDWLGLAGSPILVANPDLAPTQEFLRDIGLHRG
jgi:hypothetical protein